MNQKGRLIVIAGTDCSGKETQTKLLCERLNNSGVNTKRISYPNYDSPTGKIVGASYLGKPHMGEGVFPEGAVNVDSLVASLYFAADRRYNLPPMLEALKNGQNLLSDRYVSANEAHQGGKIKDDEKRLKFYNNIETLEYDILELPRPDQTIFLHMPFEAALKLKEGRDELPDQHEADEEHLKDAERAYLQLAKLNNWTVIECVENGKILTPEEISDRVYDACVLTQEEEQVQ